MKKKILLIVGAFVICILGVLIYNAYNNVVMMKELTPTEYREQIKK